MEWYVMGPPYDYIRIWYLEYPEYKRHHALDVPVIGSYAWFTRGHWKGIKYVTRIPNPEGCSKHGITEYHRYCSECGYIDYY